MITTEASPSEKSSPFYIQNEHFCKEWENFVLNKNGTIRGKYTSWALILEAKVKLSFDCLINIKKSTTTNGALFLKSETNKIEHSTITIFDVPTFLDSHSFKIRKRKRLNILQQQLRKTHIKLNEHYVFVGENRLKAPIELTDLINYIEHFKLQFLHYNDKKQSITMHSNSLIQDFNTLEQFMAYLAENWKSP